MPKSIFFIFCCIIFGFIFQESVFAVVGNPDGEETQTCEYISKLDQCVVANKNGQARSIDEFVCIESGDSSRILDQIILDVKFKEIDVEVEKYLEAIYADKEAVLQNPNQLIADIMYNLSKEGFYYKQYKKLCNGGLLNERLSCSEKIPNVIGSSYLDGGNFDARACLALVETKMDIYLAVVRNMLDLNKSTVQRDQIQVYRQAIGEAFQVLYDLIRDILGYLERFFNGLTFWTERPYGG